MKRSRRQIAPMEDAIQSTIIQLLHLRADPRTIYAHIPNGIPATARVGARFVRLGMLPGAADLLVITPDAVPHFIEIKSSRGYQSEPQKAFQARCQQIGVDYCLVRSTREAEAVLDGWGAFRSVVRRAA